jgi:CRISPR/Cas system-associated exonuclease Cas4 (RecB family)
MVVKKTECLFDEKTQTTEGMVSVSQLQTFMSCPKKWEYNYMDRLKPRVERAYLTIGKLCHKGMQTAMTIKWQVDRGAVNRTIHDILWLSLMAMEMEWDNYVESTNLLDDEVRDLEQVLVDAKEVFTQAFWEFDIDKYQVLSVFDGFHVKPALELHFVVPCEGSEGLHGFIDAILLDTETGCTWCTDYKFRKSLSPDEEEAFNVQNAVYSYACQKMGIDITGTMTWQHVNTPAVEPQLLRNGSVSRAKVKTTWAKYYEFCVSNSIDPELYEEEMREKLADIEWYRATYEYRNAETIENIWNDVITPAALAVCDAREFGHPLRRSLYPWNCKMCQYQSLCQGELRNYDVDAIKLREYTVRTEQRDDKKVVDDDIVNVV